MDGRVGAWRVWSEWVADAAHPEPAEHLLGYRSGGEGSERNLGDLGPRDPPTGRFVEHRIRVLDRDPSLLADAIYRVLRPGVVTDAEGRGPWRSEQLINGQCRRRLRHEAVSRPSGCHPSRAAKD